jgi:di/tricarboxylate transporter
MLTTRVRDQLTQERQHLCNDRASQPRTVIGRLKPFVKRYRMMPSDSDTLLRSIRRWVLIAVFLLGIVVVTLADIAYTVSNYEGGELSAAVGVIGGSIALVAGVMILGSLQPPSD